LSECPLWPKDFQATPAHCTPQPLVFVRRTPSVEIPKTKADSIGDIHDILFISLEIDTNT